jgi:peptidoglycan L-alanyl-D-glutamate endopeptidase CwlK
LATDGLLFNRKDAIMPYTFSKTSLDRLNTCHEKLQRLARRVLEERDCTILCGHRGQTEQNEAFANKKSKLQWPHSKHNSYPSLAMDIVPHPLPDWKDIPKFREFVEFIKLCALELNIQIECGADFKTFSDYPHVQLKEKA